MINSKPMRIFTSTLTNPPRYYVTRSYRSRIDTVAGVERIWVTGKKWDVTEEIEAIVKARSRGAKKEEARQGNSREDDERGPHQGA